MGDSEEACDCSLYRILWVRLMQCEDDFQVFEVGNSVRSKIDIDLVGTITVYSSGVIGIRRKNGSRKFYREGEFYRDFELDRWDRGEIHTPPPLYDG
jgi:hypothetical protein